MSILIDIASDSTLDAAFEWLFSSMKSRTITAKVGSRHRPRVRDPGTFLNGF